jgi:hypothetical protein
MTNQAATGRFWLCPQCRKHVSTRSATCQCGFDRSASSAGVQEVKLGQSPEYDEPKGASFVRRLAIVAVCIALAFVGVWRWNQPESAPRKLRFKTSPQVVYVPVPVVESPSPQKSAAPEDGNLESESPAVAEAASAEEPTVEPEAESPEPDKARAEERAQRKLAESIYRPRMEQVADSMRQLRALRRRYYDACFMRQTVTTKSGERRGGEASSGVGHGNSRGSTEYQDSRGRTVGYADSRGSQEVVWSGTRAWRESWNESSSVSNESTPECRLIASDISAVAPKVGAIMEAAEREAVEKNVWTWLQRDVPEKLAKELWQE